MRNLFVILIVSFVRNASLGAEEVTQWHGPDIPSLHIQRDTNGKQCVDEILKAINSIEGRRIAVAIKVSEAELLKRMMQGDLNLKNVPSAIALRYVADQLHLYLERDGVVWTLKDRLDGPDDMEVRVFDRVTNFELQKLGLSVGEKGEVSTIHPPAWPSASGSRITMVDGVLLVLAWDRDIQCLDALLNLQRNGYSVPEINSEQAGADKPATKPADKPPVKDQPSTPTSKDGPR